MPTTLAISIILSIVIGFFLALKSGSKHYSSQYIDIILNSWGKIIFSLLPIILYIAIAILKGVWTPLINSAEFALAAAIISGLGIQEMCCGIAIKHDIEISKNRVSFLSVAALTVFSVSLATTIYVYLTNQSGISVFLFQVLLFVASIFSYFGTGAVIAVVEQNVSQMRKI